MKKSLIVITILFLLNSCTNPKIVELHRLKDEAISVKDSFIFNKNKAMEYYQQATHLDTTKSNWVDEMDALVIKAKKSINLCDSFAKRLNEIDDSAQAIN